MAPCVASALHCACYIVVFITCSVVLRIAVPASRVVFCVVYTLSCATRAVFFIAHPAVLSFVVKPCASQQIPVEAYAVAAQVRPFGVE